MQKNLTDVIQFWKLC